MPSSTILQKNRHAPLPLQELQAWVTSETLTWLEQGDIQAAAFQAELEAEGVDQLIDLFANHKTNESDNDDNDDVSDRSDADFEGYYGRIRVWKSSSNNKNGVGERYDDDNHHHSPLASDDDEGEESNDEDPNANSNSIRIVYIISESWEGYGDLLWASARHLANQFANPDQCRELLLGPRRWLEGQQQQQEQQFEASASPALHHPLVNKRVLELGAGCGVPSLMAIKCGARVVCTDLDDTNRIRSLAEAMQRNWQELCVPTPGRRLSSLQKQHQIMVQNNAPLARVCPFRWGKDSQPVLKCLNPQMEERFDVVCATDCLFMPWLHYDLLQSIEELMAVDGVAIMAFCIHESFSKDQEVWPFCDKAEEKGFDVDILPPVQLTPPRKGMDAKQGLVHVLRLTRRKQQS